MNDVAQALAPNDLLAWAWRLIVWGCIAFLLILGALVFIRPAVVNRFIEGFVTSGRRINILELALRLIASLAFVAVSPKTKLPIAFFWAGVVLAITAIPIVFLHHFNRSHSAWAIPVIRRFLPLMSISAIALGGLIAWAIT